MDNPLDPGGGHGGDPSKDSTGEASGGCAGFTNQLKPVIVDGLLCSIIRTMSNTNRDDELVAAIDSEKLEQEVKASWYKLFTYYKDVLDINRKIPIIKTKRQTVKSMIEDIVRCLRMKDAISDLEVFVLPWYYTLTSFITETQKVDQAWHKETIAETEKKVNDLESRLEAKFEKRHNDRLASLHAWSDGIIKAIQPNSYAAVTANANLLLPPYPNNTRSQASLNPLDQRRIRVPSFSNVHNSESRARLNSIGGSSKRARIEPEKEPVSRNKVPSKMVVGTAMTRVSGRKMRSPPADIFVWGLHPDTTQDDIVKDLAESSIIIEEKDVMKKSREGAALLSFKVSVRAEDLQKALDPAVWPLRVKVREYIYYPRKKTDKDKNNDEASQTSNLQPLNAQLVMNSPNSSCTPLAAAVDSGQSKKELEDIIVD